MTIAIIEDEIPARQHLKELIKKVSPDHSIVIEEGSVRKVVSSLKSAQGLELIFLDIQLNDGLSFEIFDQVQVDCPVIFTTAFEQYMMDAFQRNGIDYLLKPIKAEDVSRALAKYHLLAGHFEADPMRIDAVRLRRRVEGYRNRILMRLGNYFSAINVDKVAYFFSEHRMTFLIDNEGKRSLVDEPLAQLEGSLDPCLFFRINRKYLTALSAIDRFQGDGNGRIRVNLKPSVEEEVYVSQEKASNFREWIVGS